MNRFPDTFQTVTGRSLFGPNVPHGMNTLTRRLTKSGCVAQAFSSLTHSSTVHQTIMSAMSQQLRSDLCVAAAKDQPQHRPLLPKLDFLVVDPDEEQQEEWEAEDDVKGGPLDPREVKKAREKEIKYLWDMEVYEYSAEAEARARTGRKPVGRKWTDTNKGGAEAPRYVCTEVLHKGVEPTSSATPPLETLRVLLSVACHEDVFRVDADVSRAHFHADAVRDVTSDCQTRTPRQSSQACVGNCERHTSGTDDVGGPNASQISALRRTAKWHDPPEEAKRRR